MYGFVYYSACKIDALENPFVTTQTDITFLCWNKVVIWISFSDGEKDFDREYSSMQEDHQPQDGGVEVTGAGVKHNNLNEVNHNISEGNHIIFST